VVSAERSSISSPAARNFFCAWLSTSADTRPRTETTIQLRVVVHGSFSHVRRPHGRYGLAVSTRRRVQNAVRGLLTPLTDPPTAGTVGGVEVFQNCQALLKFREMISVSIVYRHSARHPDRAYRPAVSILNHAHAGGPSL
jgi:hypothetical protein